MRHTSAKRGAKGLWLIGVLMIWFFGSVSFAAEYLPLPGLSARDRAILANSMVQHAQCRTALIEANEALKELADDETLIRIKGTCEAELLKPEAKDTITRWLKLAPQTHQDRPAMLALLAKAQSPSDVDMDWVLVPAGEFEMGAEGGPAEPDEAPKHKVDLDAFYISKHETTNAQYYVFVKTTGHRIPQNCCEPKNTLWRDGAPIDRAGELPVNNVSWDDAVAFCTWSGGRLPTEAEWEKAARGTDGRPYPWGKESPTSGNRANFSFEPVSFWEGAASLAVKDQYEFGVSPYGLYEMAGNVSEWVSDWYDPTYYKDSPSKNPKGPAEGRTKVTRGGNWRENADSIRSANRNGKHNPDERRLFIGLRCAKDGLK
ncbi:MAG: formylglycine-generating enzyme family protein [Nitrospira sp.]|nr:MAG: formylglycine-generating enzyme family protein [Nitrospira sp.]